MTDVQLTPERTRELERATNGGPHLGAALDDPEQVMRLVADRRDAWDKELEKAILEAEAEADRLRDVRARLALMARHAKGTLHRENGNG